MAIITYLYNDANIANLILIFLASFIFFGGQTESVITAIDVIIILRVNPFAAEFLLYFSSFEAGIANAISSFKWRKIFMKNRHFQYWIIGLTEHLPKPIWSNLVIFLWSKTCLKPSIYGRSITRALLLIKTIYAYACIRPYMTLKGKR